MSQYIKKILHEVEISVLFREVVPMRGSTTLCFKPVQILM